MLRTAVCVVNPRWMSQFVWIAEDARYSVLYRSFRDMTEQADWSKMSTPRPLAEVILDALALSIYDIPR